MHVKSYAKVNLTLEVLGKLESNYHEIASVIQMIDFADDLEIELAPELTVWCSHPNLNMSENLVYTALLALQRRVDQPVGVSVRIVKNMPVAAGLGGGTSNAVSSLLAACKLLGINLSDADLYALAGEIGADAYYFLSGGTALVSGWGEKTHTLPDVRTDSDVILLVSDIELVNKTPRMYGALAPSMFSDAVVTDRLVADIYSGTVISGNHLYNTFDRVALQIFPELQEVWQDFTQAADGAVHLAGSGPTLFTLVPTQRSREVVERLQSMGYQPVVSSMLGGGRG